MPKPYNFYRKIICLWLGGRQRFLKSTGFITHLCIKIDKIRNGVRRGKVMRELQRQNKRWAKAWFWSAGGISLRSSIHPAFLPFGWEVDQGRNAPFRETLSIVTTMFTTCFMEIVQACPLQVYSEYRQGISLRQQRSTESKLWLFQ